MAAKSKTDTDLYENLQVEDRVRHPKFGEGQILQRSGSGEQTRFVVAFVEEGEKLLLAKYAKLKKIRPIAAENEPEEAAENETPDETEAEPALGDDEEYDEDEEEEEEED